MGCPEGTAGETFAQKKVNINQKRKNDRREFFNPPSVCRRSTNDSLAVRDNRYVILSEA